MFILPASLGGVIMAALVGCNGVSPTMRSGFIDNNNECANTFGGVNAYGDTSDMQDAHYNDGKLQ